MTFEKEYKVEPKEISREVEVKDAEEIVKEVSREVEKAKEPKKELEEPMEIIEDEKPFTVRFTTKEMKNTRIRKAVLNLIDLKAREQRYTRYVLISQSEYDILEKYNPSFMVPWKKYAKKKKELVFKDEVGKYLGKRLVVKE